MKAAIYTESGPPEVLHLAEVPDATLRGGDVLIEVEAISIEGGEVLARGGAEEVPPPPHIPGYLAAGTVVEVGRGAFERAVGDRVVTLGTLGAYAELRAVPVGLTWRVPASMPLKQAVCVPIAFGTADEALFEFGRLQPGETVLIQGAAGGVGHAAVQLAKRAGAEVIATASRDEKLERLGALGADHTVNYRTQDPVEAIQQITDGRGVDLVVDPVGGEALRASMAVLGYRGRVILVGSIGGEDYEPPVGNLWERNQSITGIYLGPELRGPGRGDRVYRMIERHIEAVARGELEVAIDSTFPLAEAAAAHARIESRESFGRVVLTP